jgi:hypothetical protein
MLDHSERRRLRDIERALEIEDPAFAERIKGTAPATGRAWHPMKALMIAVLALSALGLLINPLVTAVGVSIALTAFCVRFARRWIDKPPRDHGDEADDPGSQPLAP